MRHRIVLVLAATMSLAGCSSSGKPAESTGKQPHPAAVTTPTVHKDPTGPPTQPSDLPDGRYRVQLTSDRVDELGGDPSDAGTVTLTIKSGGYQMDCKPVANPGVDCGAHDPSLGTTVEVGFVRGVAPTVWFVHDMQRLTEKNGCIRHSDSAQGCGPEGGYRLDWSINGDEVTWSNYVGLGDEAGPPPTGWTVPWRKIN